MPIVDEKVLKTTLYLLGKGKIYTILPKMYSLLFEKLSAVSQDGNNLVQSQAMRTYVLEGYRSQLFLGDCV